MDERKNDFLATLAHELRNPLASSVYLVAMIGYGQPSDREMAFSAGFDLLLKCSRIFATNCGLVILSDEPSNTNPVPITVEPVIEGVVAGGFRAIARNRPNRATRNPRPIMAIPVRNQASNVRSAAK